LVSDSLIQSKMLIPDFAFVKDNEPICFVNPSGLVELRVRKDRIARYLTNLDDEKNNYRLIKYLRTKIGDDTIYKIISYESCSKSYAIIRHPLQDFNNFRQAFDRCYDEVDFISKYFELFNNVNFIRNFCIYYPESHNHVYKYLSPRIKSSRRVLCILIMNNPDIFYYVPDEIKSNKKIIMYLIKKIKSYSLVAIYQYLSYELRKDPEIVALLLAGRAFSANGNDFTIYRHIVVNIPDNLINDRDFLLGICKFMPDNCCDILSLLYSYTSIKRKRDNAILLKMGYNYIGHKPKYKEIMTSKMKSDIELHKKLVKLNSEIYDLMSEELKNIIPKN